MVRGTFLTLSLLYHEQNSELRSLQPLFIDAQPGKMSLPALPRFVVAELGAIVSVTFYFSTKVMLVIDIMFYFCAI